MKKLLIILTLLAWLPIAHANDADMERAFEAYDSGDYKTAISLFKPLAEQGNAEAQYNIGLLYDRGLGAPQNYREAIKWYEKSAEQGNANAQFELGFIYDNGKGVPKNYGEAIKWYRKSAKQGNANAQTFLGAMYSVGHGASRNLIRAYMWFSTAKANGNSTGEELFKRVRRDIPSNDLTTAQDLAKQCWESNYQNCGE